jgi:hypothetical protein
MNALFATSQTRRRRLRGTLGRTQGRALAAEVTGSIPVSSFVSIAPRRVPTGLRHTPRRADSGSRPVQAPQLGSWQSCWCIEYEQEWLLVVPVDAA